MCARACFGVPLAPFWKKAQQVQVQAIGPVGGFGLVCEVVVRGGLG